MIFGNLLTEIGKELDDPKKTEDLKQDEKTYKYRIYIGGAMLERGITLENLAVTYIYRQAKKDSKRHQNDYKIDLKSELILEELHTKMDLILRNQKTIIKNNKKK